MDPAALETLVKAWAMPGWATGLHTLRIMANRGLVSPGEVEEVADALTAHLQVDDDDPRREAFDQLSANIEGLFAPVLAEIRQTAAERWIGKGKTNLS